MNKPLYFRDFLLTKKQLYIYIYNFDIKCPIRLERMEAMHFWYYDIVAAA